MIFLLVGLWAAKTLSDARAPFTTVIWLYAGSQVVFLVYFGGAVTMKMAVLVEQMLMVAMVAVMAIKTK